MLVLAEQRGDGLHRGSWEAVAAAQEMTSTPGDVHAVVCGSDCTAAARELAAAALGVVYVIDRPELALYTPDGYVEALAQAIPGLAPELVILPHTYRRATSRPSSPRAWAARSSPTA